MSIVDRTSLSQVNATVTAETDGRGEGWDWDGLDGLGDDDPPAHTRGETASAPSSVSGLRVASLKTGTVSFGGAGKSEDTTRRKEDFQRRREARR